MINVRKFKSYLACIIISSALICTLPLPVNAGIDPISAAKSTKQTISYHLKQPTGKKKLLLKFLLAMLGVATSSVVIFVLLSMYNRLLCVKKSETPDSDADSDYKTPVNMKDAINIFLKKTK
ncbi:MAG: hypothetical protein LUB59_06835 [Candidatus Gastranaerophilales bacterium]|nr:hypothetical protein [Candidatus Gastranaerophilales bacterium]